MDFGTWTWKKHPSNKDTAHREQMAHCCSLSGAWVLDIARSDMLEGYLRCLNVPEADIQARVIINAYRAEESTTLLEHHHSHPTQ